MGRRGARHTGVVRSRFRTGRLWSYGDIGPFKVTLAADAALLFDFRRSLRDWLRASALTDEGRQAVVLAVHEAVANGIDHGTRGSPVLVEARAEGADVIVDVTTAGSWVEHEADRCLDPRGRGFPLMCGLTDGLEVLAGGGSVTVRLRVAPGV